MKKASTHIGIAEGQHYANARTLYSIWWDKTTNTFSVTFAPDYWNYFKDKTKREATMWQKQHQDEICGRLKSIIETSDWPAKLCIDEESK